MWSNHLNPEATTVTYEIEKIVHAGDPATPRLAAPWRERMEDAVWALMLTRNSSTSPNPAVIPKKQPFLGQN